MKGRSAAGLAHATRPEKGDWFETCDLKRARSELVSRLIDAGWWVKALSGGQALIESPRIGGRQATIQIERPRSHSAGRSGTVIVSVTKVNQFGVFQPESGWRASFVPSTPDDALELFLIAAMEGMGEDGATRESEDFGAVKLNTNLLRHKLCPGCGWKGPFRVRSEGWVLVSDREVKLVDTVEELDPQSEFECPQCDRSGLVHELDRFSRGAVRTGDDEPGTPYPHLAVVPA